MRAWCSTSGKLTDWLAAIGRPKTMRDLANATVSSITARAAPSAASGERQRDTLKRAYMIALPWPASPSVAPSGTRTSRNSTLPSAWARAPICAITALVTPGSVVGTRSSTIFGLLPSAQAIFAETASTSAPGIVLTCTLLPLRTNASPSSTALASIADKSEPAFSSDVASATTHSPA